MYIDVPFEFLHSIHVGRSHQRLPLVDERTLTRRLLGGSYRDGDDGGEQQTHSGSSTPGRKIPTTTLSSNSTKTMGNSVVSGGGREGDRWGREKEREREGEGEGGREREREWERESERERGREREGG